MSLWNLRTRRSQVALDWVNFFLADVETGVGPFMAAYFVATRHWNPAQVGTVLAAQKLAAVLAQVPAGWAIDRSTFKSVLLAGTALVIGVGALLIGVLPTIPGQVINQAAVGFATAVATPLVAAISLGMVGRAKLGHRIGRNEVFSHSGNLLTASFAGYLGYATGLSSIFYVCAGFGIGCAIAAMLIRKRDIDDNLAREAPEETRNSAIDLRQILTRPSVLPFAIVVVLFHIANAAMLPLVGEELSSQKVHSVALYMSACIVIGQLIMIPSSFISGRLADRIGRKPILLIGFVALLLRGVLFSLGRSPNYLVAVEALDGIGTGVAGVLTVLIISDLAKNSGRFNFLQGVIQACLGIGSFLGNLIGGFAAKSIGFSAAFLGLAGIAVVGLILYAAIIPETSPRKTG